MYLVRKTYLNLIWILAPKINPPLKTEFYMNFRGKMNQIPNTIRLELFFKIDNFWRENKNIFLFKKKIVPCSFSLQRQKFLSSPDFLLWSFLKRPLRLTFFHNFHFESVDLLSRIAHWNAGQDSSQISTFCQVTTLRGQIHTRKRKALE